MSNSINFCKQRAEENSFNFLPDAKFTETNSYEVLKTMLNDPSKDISSILKDGLKIADNVKVIYNPEADFDYFTNYQCRNDGTLLFKHQAQQEVLLNVMNLKTHCTSKVPDDFVENFGDYDVTYTIGNIVSVCEHSDEFGTKEKPWMKQRDTAMLPIKFEVKKRLVVVLDRGSLC